MPAEYVSKSMLFYIKYMKYSDKEERQDFFLFVATIRDLMTQVILLLEKVENLEKTNEELLKKVDELNERYELLKKKENSDENIDEENSDENIDEKVKRCIENKMYFDLPLDDEEITEKDYFVASVK
jgi:hypothetical protein